MAYYTEPRIATIDFDEASEAARITWQRFMVSLPKYRRIMSSLLALVEDKQARGVLVDTSKTVGALSKEVLEHYAEVLPLFKQAGVVKVATLLPWSQLSIGSTVQWQAFESEGITFRNFGDLEEARAWLREPSH